ncbi:MAG: helix-turn-helix transcriptional regulator [Proteobacteria bacterium]|nr:helix-turn-helix transcriptional regulator [Pseudomonadota bacterium]
MSTSYAYPSALPRVIDALGSGDFAPALLEFIRAAANFDSAVIMAYPDTGALHVIHNALHDGDQSGFGSAYRNRLWLLSPLYLSAKTGMRGFFHILDIAPDNFRNSEYYKLYYQSNGVKDQAVFLLESGNGSPIAVSLERTQALRAFSKRDKSRLGEIAGTVAALVEQQWPTGVNTRNGGPSEPRESNLHLHVENLLQQFGSSYLTPRERDVVQLILKGYPSKTAAQQLGISTQTEQVHRKNIYHKLGLSSHGELFSLFFDALVQPGPGSDDPLAGLLGHSTTT